MFNMSETKEIKESILKPADITIATRVQSSLTTSSIRSDKLSQSLTFNISSAGKVKIKHFQVGSVVFTPFQYYSSEKYWRPRCKSEKKLSCY